MTIPVQITVADDGTAVVAIMGEIDFANADDVSQRIQDAVTRWSPAAVRVDLREATFIDSTGLGALIAGYRAAVDAETPFVVVNPSTSFRRVLTVTGLCDLFGVTDGEQTSDGAQTSDGEHVSDGAHTSDMAV